MSSTGEPTLRDVLSAIEGIRQDVEGIRQDVEGIRQDVSKTNVQLETVVTEQAQRWTEQETENRVILDRIDSYQKASTQVVNLAFALIGTATVALVGIILRLAVNL
ncbi:MAG: hypothetical protein Q6L68_00770 [Thermostichus sp. DG02_5_bins_236]